MPDISQWTSALFQPQQRSIGGIIAQVTVEETERDELIITEHPVEQGAPISDHAFKRPSEVIIRAGWSAAGPNGPQDLSAQSGVYGYLLSWQAALVPFDLFTGKRAYHDMLIASITATTDETSEFALMATIVCRQVILVSTQVGQADTSTQARGIGMTQSDHADPSRTAPAIDLGTVNGTQVFGGADQSVIDFSTGGAF